MGEAFGEMVFSTGMTGYQETVTGTGRVQITSPNQGFAVAPPAGAPGPFQTEFGPAEVSHINLNDGVAEGLRLVGAPAFGVQYHPGAASRPHDAPGGFARSCRLMDATRRPPTMITQAFWSYSPKKLRAREGGPGRGGRAGPRGGDGEQQGLGDGRRGAWARACGAGGGGFEIWARQGTAEVLRRNGVHVTIVRKHSEGAGPGGEPGIAARVLAGQVDLIMNTPFGSPGQAGPWLDGYEIRTAAVRRGVGA
jgi:hypothetical protein